MFKNNEAKEKDNKSSEKERKHDPCSGITGGLILVLLGVLFLLSTMDVISWGDWWAYFLLGLGAILILEVIVRSLVPAYRQHHKGKLVAGAVLIIVGGAHIIGMVHWWPLILIAVGIIILFSSLRKA